MHELGIALDIVDIATRRAAGARVRRIALEVGALTAVLPDALQFAFEVAVEGTSLAGAVLELRPVPGRATCRACQRDVELSEPFGTCSCGGYDLDFKTGDQLRIIEMEVH
jgi:hydrogenase nickel incorporation protein HypA/HybF